MRSAKTKEYKWQAYILAAINSEEWQNRWEVEDRLKAIMPPEAFVRASERYWNQRTVHSFECTIVCSTIRYLMRGGLIERSIPLDGTNANLGNYSLRLTKKGLVRRNGIYHYFCKNCFNSNLSRAKCKENITCGNCRSRHLTITKL